MPKQNAASKTYHTDRIGYRGHHARTPHHDICAAAIRLIQNSCHSSRTRFDRYVCADLLREVVLESATAIPITLPAPCALASWACSWPDNHADHRHRFAQRNLSQALRVKARSSLILISGAIRMSRESGSRKTWLAGTAAYSANPPLVSRPIKPPARHRLVCPMRQ